MLHVHLVESWKVDGDLECDAEEEEREKKKKK